MEASNLKIPVIEPSCVTESFGAEISYENRLTKEDIEKHIKPRKKQAIDTANLPFKLEDDHTSLDKKFPMYISKVLEAYDSGCRYKEFRNILKKQKRKEEKLKNSAKLGYAPMPQIQEKNSGVFGSVIRDGKYSISLD